MPARRSPRRRPDRSASGDPPAAPSTHRIVAHHGVEVEVEPLGAEPASEERQRVRVGRRSGHVVGDEVALVRGGEGLLRAPRRTVLERRAAGGHGRRAVAANLGTLAVVVSREPPPRVGLIDRAIVASRRGGIEPILVVNKADLEGVAAFARGLSAELGPALEVLEVSAASGQGVDALEDRLRRGGLAALIGPSGVGKSSLTNRLVPEAGLATAALSDATGRGRHTTTTSTLWRSASGLMLIDTPGVRDFGLVDVEPAEVAVHFAGFEGLGEGCQFRDCLHDGEPGCEVAAAAASGAVPAGRLEAYRRLLQEVAPRGRG